MDDYMINELRSLRFGSIISENNVALLKYACARIERLEAKVSRYRKALSFYANKQHYNENEDGVKFLIEDGEEARQALKEYNKP